MKWQDIHQKYPNQFVLLGNIVEEKISDFKTKVVAGTVLGVFNDGKAVRSAYREHKHKGEEVLYSLPTTTDEFIVEIVPFKGYVR